MRAVLVDIKNTPSEFTYPSEVLQIIECWHDIYGLALFLAVLKCNEGLRDLGEVGKKILLSCRTQKNSINHNTQEVMTRRIKGDMEASVGCMVLA